MNEGSLYHDASAEETACAGQPPAIEWSAAFSMGGGTIDQQHRQIFDLALEASQLSHDAGKIDRLRQILDEFGALISEHFRYEEAQLAEMGFPDLDAHRAEHQAMLAQLACVRHRVTQNAEGLSFHEKALLILNLMIAVAVGHILHSDKACMP